MIELFSQLLKKEISKFLLAGGLTFFVDYGILYFLVAEFGCYYLLAAGISFVVAVLFSYWLCRNYVFANTKGGSLAAFVLVSIAGLLLNQVCMWGFTDGLAWHYLVAKVFATIIVTGWNYYAKKMVLQRG